MLGPFSVCAAEVWCPVSQVSFPWTGAVSANSSFIANGLNCYRKVATVTNTCDKNGNHIIDGTDTWTYDTDNRLVDALPVAAAKAGSHNAALRYDPLGRLYEVTAYANTDTARATVVSRTRFLYGGDELLAEYSGAGTMTARYVHGADGAADDPLAWYTGAGAPMTSAAERFLRSDWQGSISLVTDTSGTTQVARNTFDEYGIRGSANAGRFQYTGQA